jgi:aminoglycoside 6'-N-acetyltransferase
VAQWWGAPPSSQDVAAEYEPQLSGEDPTQIYIVSLAGRQIGMTQTYRWANNEQEATEIGALPGEAGMDYFIGEPDLVGQGIGALMLGSFLEQIVFADPEVTGVCVPIDVRNERSWRCLQKLGFERGEPLPRHGGEVQYVPRLARGRD